MTSAAKPLTETEERRKNDAALRLSMLIWAYQDGEITKAEGIAQAKADPDIMRYWVANGGETDGIK